MISLCFPLGKVNHYAIEVFLFTGVVEGCFLQRFCALAPIWCWRTHWTGVTDHFLCMGLCITDLFII